MGLTLEEIRALAIKCGAYTSAILVAEEIIFVAKALTAYTAEIEAKRDEEVAGLKSDIAVRDEYVETLRERERELTRKLAEQQGRISQLESVIGEVNAWAVCGCIAAPSDMIQNLPHIVDITSN